MTRPRSYEECLADRQTIRKRGGTPRPLPADLEPARQAFETAIVKSLTAEDPATALERAITEAASQIIAKAIAALDASGHAGRPGPAAAGKTRQEGHAMEATDYITKGGTVWQLIEARAAQHVKKTVGTMTRDEKAKAVSEFLSTAEGKKLYDEYTAEADRVVQQHARARLDPPPGVKP